MDPINIVKQCNWRVITLRNSVMTMGCQVRIRTDMKNVKKKK